eukprot:1198134-Rhodomonas_salina.1
MADTVYTGNTGIQCRGDHWGRNSYPGTRVPGPGNEGTRVPGYGYFNNRSNTLSVRVPDTGYCAKELNGKCIRMSDPYFNSTRVRVPRVPGTGVANRARSTTSSSSIRASTIRPLAPLSTMNTTRYQIEAEEQPRAITMFDLSFIGAESLSAVKTSLAADWHRTDDPWGAYLKGPGNPATNASNPQAGTVYVPYGEGGPDVHGANATHTTSLGVGPDYTNNMSAPHNCVGGSEQGCIPKNPPVGDPSKTGMTSTLPPPATW